LLAARGGKKEEEIADLARKKQCSCTRHTWPESENRPPMGKGDLGSENGQGNQWSLTPLGRQRGEWARARKERDGGMILSKDRRRGKKEHQKNVHHVKKSGRDEKGDNRG